MGKYYVILTNNETGKRNPLTTLVTEPKRKQLLLCAELI